MIIYDNNIKNMGSMVEAFGNEMAILFGDNAPDTLKDYCYTIDVKDADDKIEVGDTIIIDDEKFSIKAIGDLAQKNLEALGHLTINFTGDESGLLPGAIVVEKKDCPKINIGTRIVIEK
ncbi:PTS glucitol/sorbitol transporter subunit IIA [Peptostreptococcus russellii]|uniref:PTS system, glucitol/sorbitol-specific IIA component n=1 Tax=Peptostreptococcus russellii TaxID=215200 RepID=A0A1H8G638_9FIRM|nr:PTS glucitol/sorbitol transporter subunit IIA [Peptostreptococcus russellii]MBC2578197.1 PTS glucitol/sorbitol transporter subunit IIA [Peptostreptococcus russellii]SEN39453.1 PTS system, glucitol/sorbitol-specific IIA component [Peptostreptococcus russellii]